jgi:hypothetical protein
MADEMQFVVFKLIMGANIGIRDPDFQRSGNYTLAGSHSFAPGS